MSGGKARPAFFPSLDDPADRSASLSQDGRLQMFKKNRFYEDELYFISQMYDKDWKIPDSDAHDYSKSTATVDNVPLKKVGGVGTSVGERDSEPVPPPQGRSGRKRRGRKTG